VVVRELEVAVGVVGWLWLRDAVELRAPATQLAHVGMIVRDKAAQEARLIGDSHKLLKLKANERLGYDAVKDAIVGQSQSDDAQFERILKVGTRDVPVRLFIRPSNDPNQIMVAFQTISATTGAA